MVNDPAVFELLEEMLDRGQTPEEACRDRPELLAEVRRRWQEFRRINAALGELLPAPGTVPNAGALTPIPLAAGLPRIPGYEVEAILGSGGMGVVYKARQLALDRPVAVKMLLAGAFAAPEELGRFHREAAALAELRHPNIVQVYDAGDVEGRPYFTMELVDGGSLAQYLANNRLSVRQAAELVATLAAAMHFAHDNGIIHRDLKPGNILLTAPPAVAGLSGQGQPLGTPKIADFGLARSISGGTEYTLSGARLGTPSYMAPEQALGKTSALGPAVDVYALGAVLYETLTGRPPFVGDTPGEMERQIIEKEPKPPSRFNSHVPRDLDTICLKCLRKHPTRRYASGQELAEDLHRFLEGQPIHARPVGAGERVVKWARRRPTAALLIAALVVMAGSAAGVGFWLRQREVDHQAARSQQQDQARKAVNLALEAANVKGQEERWQEALLILNEAATHLPEAGSPELTAQLHQTQSDCRNALDLEHARENSPLEVDGYFYYQQRAAEFKAAFERAGVRVDADTAAATAFICASAIRAQLVAALDDWALAAFMTNEQALVERLLEVARSADPEPHWADRFRTPAKWHDRKYLQELAVTAFTTTPPPSGHQLALLGLLLRRAGARSESSQLLTEACRRQPGNYWLNCELGLTLLLENRPLEAVSYYRAAIALRPHNAGAYQRLGESLWRGGQTEAAIAAYRQMAELAPSHRSTNSLLVNIYVRSGHWAEAVAECKRALKANPGDRHPLWTLAYNLLENHREEDAIALLREEIDTGPKNAAPYSDLGFAYARAGRHEEAVKALRKATELVPADAEASQRFARELNAVGRPEEAIAELQRTIIAKPYVIDSFYTDLGTWQRMQGRPKEAALAFQKAATRAPQNVVAWDGLAAALLDQGCFAEARAAAEHLLQQSASPLARRAQQRQLKLCDSLLAADATLPAILAGKEPGADVATQRAVAEWCLKHRRLPAIAARLYETVLAAEPSLADDLEVGNRFDAACAAAVGGCGGDDALMHDDYRQAVLRREAFDWLTAEYNAWAEHHRRGKPGDRTLAATAVRSWLQNRDLAGVRDEQALARLSVAERQNWQTLWANVTALAARDPVMLFERGQAHFSREEWTKAAACYAEGLDLEPTDNSEVWFEYAAVQFLAKDLSGYRRTCAYLLARSEVRQLRPYFAARAGTLAPVPPDELERMNRSARNELQSYATAFWSLTEQAALEIRAGHFGEAIPLLERSLVADGRPGKAVLNWLWLAIAYRQLGNTDEARRWLDKAVGWLDQQTGQMPPDTAPLGMHRHNWLEAHVLRQEAESLLR